MNIAFYGIGTFDTVHLVSMKPLPGYFYNCETYTQAGGAHNCIRMLNTFYKDRVSIIDLEDDIPVTVLVEKSGQKTSFADWPMAKKFKPLHADWNHVVYPDICNAIEPSFLSSLNGIISADVTKFVPTTILPYLDYLFVDSQIAYYADLAKWGSMMKTPSSVVIAHASEEILIWSNGEYTNIRLPSPLKHINPLGAGDYFAASFIAENENKNLRDRVLKAASMTAQYLEIFQPYDN